MKSLNDFLYYIALQDLKTYHYKVLLLLLKNPTTQSAAGKLLNVSRQNIHKIFKDLECMGLIEVCKVEGKNKFYKTISNYEVFEDLMPGQLKI